MSRNDSGRRGSRLRRLRSVQLGPILAAVTLAAACSTNPVSGRREVILVTLEEERETGRLAADQVAEIMGIVDDPDLTAYVDELGQRLAAASPRKDVDYTFQIVDMDVPNAFALPGGYVYVSRGLIAISNSEDELACVIAHEIGHIAARHHARQQTGVKSWGLLTFPFRLAGGLAPLVGGLVRAPVELIGSSIFAVWGR